MLDGARLDALLGTSMCAVCPPIQHVFLQSYDNNVANCYEPHSYDKIS